MLNNAGGVYDQGSCVLQQTARQNMCLLVLEQLLLHPHETC